jgi:3,5-epimerase/4-reductase
MKVLFYGDRGWIGSMIIKKWSEIYPDDNITCSTTRLSPENISIIEEEIKNTDIVFSAIGRTSGTKDGVHIPNIDYLETNLNENVRDNLYNPLMLAKICDKYNKYLSYIGTGCIFSRDTNNNDYIYTEEDIPDFFGSGYSIVKGYTDNLMKLFDNVLNFRIRMPIVDYVHPKNFITKISEFKNICSYQNSMTYLPDIIPMMIELSRLKISGTYNMVNKGSMSHEEILELYKQIVDEKHTYNLIDIDNLDTILKAKRSNNILSSKKLEDAYPISLRSLRDCVIEALQNMKK